MSKWTQEQIEAREAFIERMNSMIRNSEMLITRMIGFMVAEDDTVGVGFFGTCSKHKDCFAKIIKAGIDTLEGENVFVNDAPHQDKGGN